VRRKRLPSGSLDLLASECLMRGVSHSWCCLWICMVVREDPKTSSSAGTAKVEWICGEGLAGRYRG
jgi:hypothetical protein